jgi:hypothetical protein
MYHSTHQIMTTELKTSPLTRTTLEDFWKHALPYSLYRGLVESLAVMNKTTGFEQTEERISATKLNVARMSRVEKTFALTPQLREALDQLRIPLKWLVISEGWCGDSAQILPALHKIAEASGGKIQMKTTLRDENPELMDAFLSNGTRSVPKLICMDDSFNVLATWGPRPETAQQLVLQLKSDPRTAPLFKEELHKWYAKDRSQTIEEEIAKMLTLVNALEHAKN